MKTKPKPRGKIVKVWCVVDYGTVFTSSFHETDVGAIQRLIDWTDGGAMLLDEHYRNSYLVGRIPAGEPAQ